MDKDKKIIQNITVGKNPGSRYNIYLRQWKLKLLKLISY